MLAEKIIVVQWHAIRYLEQFDKVTRMKHTLFTLWLMVMKIKKSRSMTLKSEIELIANANA